MTSIDLSCLAAQVQRRLIERLEDRDDRADLSACQVPPYPAAYMLERCHATVSSCTHAGTLSEGPERCPSTSGVAQFLPRSLRHFFVTGHLWSVSVSPPPLLPQGRMRAPGESLPTSIHEALLPLWQRQTLEGLSLSRAMSRVTVVIEIVQPCVGFRQYYCTSCSETHRHDVGVELRDGFLEGPVHRRPHVPFTGTGR